MVVMVGRIQRTELEISDGWYSLRCPLQYGDPLHKLVLSGRICEGTKLLVQGSVLVGGDQGSHPLDAPDTLRLELQVNGCRRVYWWTKLGPCRPMSSELRSLIGGGGPTPLLRVIIARTYPILYCVRDNNKTEYLR